MMHIHRSITFFFIFSSILFFSKKTAISGKNMLQTAMRSANNGSIVPVVDAVEFADDWNIIEILVERIHGAGRRGTTGVCGCLPPSRQTHVTPRYVTPAVCVWHAQIQQGTQQTNDAYCLQYVTQCTTRGFHLPIIYGWEDRKSFR